MASATAFESRWGRVATHVSMAPGRINLIGEHTDYNGLPVLPMAIRQAVRVVLAPREDSTLRVANADGSFEAAELHMARDATPGPPGAWTNYVLAPAVELCRRYGPLRGFDGLVGSDLPVAAGLSSSSALVIAVGLALARLNRLPLKDLELASAMADAERFTGTRGGGMDQAISLCALEGHATRVDFGPLRLDPVPLPGDWVFVVAHSLSRAEKSGAAQEAYNLRGRECARALERLAGSLTRGAREAGPSRGPEGRVDALGELVTTYGRLLERASPEELLDVAARELDPVLLRRFRHVVTEALRVDEAREAMVRGDLATFGGLMTASHASLRDDYEVSAPGLDELVELALEGGAAGARLTGAGFGGCAIALCLRDQAPGVLAALREFYVRRSAMVPGANGATEVPPGRLFIAESSRGARFDAL